MEFLIRGSRVRIAPGLPFFPFDSSLTHSNGWSFDQPIIDATVSRSTFAHRPLLPGPPHLRSPGMTPVHAVQRIWSLFSLQSVKVRHFKPMGTRELERPLPGHNSSGRVRSLGVADTNRHALLVFRL